MSLSGGTGAAHDPTAMVSEPAMSPEVEAYLRGAQDRAHEQYERNHRIKGTREYDAHVAQLRRLRDEAADAYERTKFAADRAREHAAGKDDAVREAATALNGAELALDDFLRGVA